MIVNKTYKPYFESDKRFNVLWGGGGSGKSYAIAENKVKRVVSSPDVREMILRKNYVSHKESTYALFTRVILNEGLYNDFDFRVSPLNITYKPNGSSLMFLGMKDEKDREKVKSIVDPTGAWLEEANEFDIEDLRQVNLRLRGIKGLKRQIDISFNPIDEEHWLNDRFFENPPDPENIFTLNSTYLDNLSFLDAEYVEMLEGLVNEDENYYNIYTLGKWGSLDVRGRIYKKYDDELNIVDYRYNPDLPIKLACDFNVDPMKWALIQTVNGIDYIFDEVVKVDTDTESTVKEVIERYGRVRYIIYGDYSGTFRHTSSRSTDYDIILQYLPGAELRVQPNPSVIDRINAVNWRLCNKEQKRRLLVDRKCVNVRTDFKKAKFKEGSRDEDKTLEKYDGKNPLQSLIHISSAIGYYIVYEYSLKGRSVGKQW